VTGAGSIPEAWRRVRKSNRAMAGIVVSLIGLALLFQGLWAIPLQLYLRAAGVAAPAEVAHVFRGRAGEQTRLQLTFVDDAGERRQVTLPTRSSAWQRGQRTTVVHAAGLPRLAMLESMIRSDRALLEGAVLGAIGMVLTPVGFWLYLGFRWRARLASGRVAHREAEGRILGLVERPYQFGGHRPKAVSYEFTAVDGRRYRGRSPDLPQGTRAPEGGAVRVRYTRSDPGRSIPVAW